MSTQDEILKSFEKQCNMMRDQLIHGCYENAVKSAEIMATWLKVKVNELGERDGDLH
jgi:hypothetical protein